MSKAPKIRKLIEDVDYVLHPPQNVPRPRTPLTKLYEHVHDYGHEQRQGGITDKLAKAKWDPSQSSSVEQIVEQKVRHRDAAARAEKLIREAHRCILSARATLEDASGSPLRDRDRGPVEGFQFVSRREVAEANDHLARRAANGET